MNAAESPDRRAPLLKAAWLPFPRPVDARFSAWLDLFRWLAAFAVCSSHVRALVLSEYEPGTSPGWLAGPFYFLTAFGQEAVIIFFVLSGYLIGGEVLRGFQRGDFDGRHYAVRRLSRLYAVYLAALLLGALWDWLGLHFFNARQLYTTYSAQSPMIFYDISARLNGGTFLGNLCFTQTILVPTFGSNSPLWSLANEVWYYALFPLFVWPLFASAGGWARLTALLMFAAAVWIVRGDVLLYFLMWLVGVSLRFLSGALLPSQWLAPIGIALVLAASRLHLLLALPDFAKYLLLATVFALWLNSLEYGSWHAPGRASWHRFMAGFSYTLYLTHWPLLLLLGALLEQGFGIGYRMPFGLSSVVCTGMLLCVTYLYGLAVAGITERHTIRLREWLVGLTGIAPRFHATTKA